VCGCLELGSGTVNKRVADAPHGGWVPLDRDN
jgi:hypothetical protein